MSVYLAADNEERRRRPSPSAVAVYSATSVYSDVHEVVLASVADEGGDYERLDPLSSVQPQSTLLSVPDHISPLSGAETGETHSISNHSLTASVDNDDNLPSTA